MWSDDCELCQLIVFPDYGIIETAPFALGGKTQDILEIAIIQLSELAMSVHTRARAVECLFLETNSYLP